MIAVFQHLPAPSCLCSIHLNILFKKKKCRAFLRSFSHESFSCKDTFVCTLHNVLAMALDVILILVSAGISGAELLVR